MLTDNILMQFEEFYRPDTEAMEDQLLTCTLLLQCGTGPILLYENHKCRSMKTLRLVEAMEDLLLTYALLLQYGTGPILHVKSSSVEDGLGS